MAVKNFVFRENWVDSKVVSMKANLFAIFDQTWTHILGLKVPTSKGFLKQYFSFKKTELILISIL